MLVAAGAVLTMTSCAVTVLVPPDNVSRANSATGEPATVVGPLPTIDSGQLPSDPYDAVIDVYRMPAEGFPANPHLLYFLCCQRS